MTGRFLAIWVILTLLLSGPAVADDKVGSGDRLAMMKKMQGNWQTDCEMKSRAGATVFEQTVLYISFTHLRFTTTRYANRDCSLKLREDRTRYAYTLGEPAALEVGARQVFELNIKAPEEDPGVLRIALQNLVAFEDGQLLLGLRRAGDDLNTRVTQLDLRSPYRRY